MITRLLGTAPGELIALAPRPLRRRFTLLVIASIFGGVAELLTVGAIVPLLMAASDPGRIGRIPLIGDAIVHAVSAFGPNPVIGCAILFSVFGIAAAAIRFLVLWLSQDFVYACHKAIVLSMYSGILSQAYEWFTSHNGGDFIATVDKVFAMASNMLVAFVAAVPALMMSAAILIFLFLLNPAIAISITVALALVYGAIAYFVLRSVGQLSKSAAMLRDRRTRFAQEAWGAARDIIIDRTKGAYLDEARKLEDRFADIHVRASLMGLAPRIIVDVVILLLVSSIVVILASTPSDLLLAIPLLAAFAIGGQRLIPLLQQIYLAYANQKIYGAYVGDAAAYAGLNRRRAAAPAPARGIEFRSTLQLRNVSFSYAAGTRALSNVSLLIRRGSRVAIVGKTGSGKSTLADIIMGLILPLKGEVLVDGVPLSPEMMSDWHAKIAHVPQNIFLTDDSLLANVAFAERDRFPDPARALHACADAGLSDLVGEDGLGLGRKVGERGVQLSGGQRQRIGIARALYKGAELLVLDEATSALDFETEKAVLGAIMERRPGITILIISHRPASLDCCNQIIRLRNGEIVDG